MVRGALKLELGELTTSARLVREMHEQLGALLHEVVALRAEVTLLKLVRVSGGTGGDGAEAGADAAGVDAFREVVESALGEADEVHVPSLVAQLCPSKPEDKSLEARVTAVLKSLEWEHFRPLRDGKRQFRWRRPGKKQSARRRGVLEG
jgi:hypothetical protein